MFRNLYSQLTYRQPICRAIWNNTPSAVKVLSYLYLRIKLLFSIKCSCTILNKPLPWWQKLVWLKAHMSTNVMLLVEPSEIEFGFTKGGILSNVITYNVVWANQKNKSFTYCLLRSHAMFDLTCFPVFVGISDVISSILLISLFYQFNQLRYKLFKNKCFSYLIFDTISLNPGVAKSIVRVVRVVHLLLRTRNFPVDLSVDKWKKSYIYVFYFQMIAAKIEFTNLLLFYFRNLDRSKGFTKC